MIRMAHVKSHWFAPAAIAPTSGAVSGPTITTSAGSQGNTNSQSRVEGRCVNASSWQACNLRLAWGSGVGLYVVVGVEEIVGNGEVPVRQLDLHAEVHDRENFAADDKHGLDEVESRGARLDRLHTKMENRSDPHNWAAALRVPITTRSDTPRTCGASAGPRRRSCRRQCSRATARRFASRTVWRMPS